MYVSALCENWKLGSVCAPTQSDQCLPVFALIVKGDKTPLKETFLSLSKKLTI